MSLNKKSVRSINNFDDIEPLMNANPGRLSDKDRRLTHIDGWQPSQGNEFVSENEDDELIQSQRKREVNLSANAAEDHNWSYQKKDRNKDGSRTDWIGHAIFIKESLPPWKRKGFMDTRIWQSWATGSKLLETTFHRILTPRKSVWCYCNAAFTRFLGIPFSWS